MNTFYTESELQQLGIKQFGKNVYIGKNAIIYNPEKIEIGHDVRIDDYCILSGKIKLGNYIHISHFCGLYGGNSGINMEDFSGLSSKVTVYGVSDDYSGRSMTNPMIPNVFKPGAIEAEVFIKKHAIVGAGSIIFPGVVIEQGSCVGSMSLCNKSTEAWSVNVGIPAKKIREREKDILLLEERFLEQNYE